MSAECVPSEGCSGAACLPPPCAIATSGSRHGGERADGGASAGSCRGGPVAAAPAGSDAGAGECDPRRPPDSYTENLTVPADLLITQKHTPFSGLREGKHVALSAVMRCNQEGTVAGLTTAGCRIDVGATMWGRAWDPSACPVRVLTPGPCLRPHISARYTPACCRTRHQSAPVSPAACFPRSPIRRCGPGNDRSGMPLPRRYLPALTMPCPARPG